MSFARHYPVLCLFFLILMTGCVKQVKQVEVKKPESAVSAAAVNETIAQAEGYLGVVKDSGGRESCPDDFGQAERKLSNAKTELKKDNRDQAYSEAKGSLTASKLILKKITVGPLRQQALELKDKILKKGPDSSLKALLPKLDRILRYAENVEKGQQEVSLRDFFEVRNELEKMGQGIKSNRVENFESDVFFGIGRYELSDEGKKKLEQLADAVFSARDSYLKQFESSKMTVRINAYGYTDELPFAEGSKLVRKLGEGAAYVPRGFPERRKFLNKRLSQLRAGTIAEYLKQRLLERHAKSRDRSMKMDIMPMPEGRGEDMPKDENGRSRIPPPYPTNDPRRRICIADSSCEFE